MSSILEFPCKNASYKIHLSSGVYKFELWGASGGDYINIGGRGGYVSGYISLSYSRTFYIFPGAQGRTNNQVSFNGGGKGTDHLNVMQPSGGGGSDIRLKILPS